MLQAWQHRVRANLSWQRTHCAQRIRHNVRTNTQSWLRWTQYPQDTVSIWRTKRLVVRLSSLFRKGVGRVQAIRGGHSIGCREGCIAGGQSSPSAIAHQRFHHHWSPSTNSALDRTAVMSLCGNSKVICVVPPAHCKSMGPTMIGSGRLTTGGMEMASRQTQRRREVLNACNKSGPAVKMLQA
jgi:hypothetical protein